MAGGSHSKIFESADIILKIKVYILNAETPRLIPYRQKTREYALGNVIIHEGEKQT